MEECVTCKKHYTQGGDCYEYRRKNCLLYEYEPKGKMISTKIKFPIDSTLDFETPIIKSGEKIVLEDKGNAVEALVNRVVLINLDERCCLIEISYHENEMPSFEMKKLFRIVD